MTNAPQTINDLEFNKFLEVAGKVGIRVLLTHGDGWKVPVDTLTSLPPAGNEIGDVRIALDTRIPYVWNGSVWTIWSWASSSWGGISGTLADQADLQSALNGKMSAGAYVFTSRDSLIANQVNLGLLTTGMLKITVSGGIATPSIVSPTNWDAAYTHTTNTSNPHSVTKAQVGLGNVDNTSDANKPVSTAQASADTTVLNSAKAYADSLVVGLVDDRGNYNASTNLFPATGGSGSAGAVLKGDLWTVSVAGTLGGQAVTAGDLVRALVDTPGQTSSNWAVTENNIGYVAENQVNKVTAIAGNETSNVVYPTVKALYDWANPLITARALDSAVVHIGGSELVTGYKGFSNNIGMQNDSDAVIFFNKTDGTNRWAIFKNSSQDLVVNRYNDSGVFQDNPLHIDGATGYTKIQTGLYNYKKLALGASKDSNGLAQILGEIEVGYLDGGWGSGYLGINAPSTTPYSVAPQRAITVLSSGNVGIGKTDPGYKLDVAGDIGLSGSIKQVTTQRALGNDMIVKNNANAGGVKFSLFVDADGAVVGNRKWNLYGYPLKHSDGSPGGYESFMVAEFDTYDGDATFTKKIVLNADRVESTYGIKVGNSTITDAGTIRWNGTKFQGYTGSVWVDFH